jgi:REP element-mobilizing transposase RayT
MHDGAGPPLDPLRFPQRRSVRLKGHDYGSGLYFVTICIQGRRPLLGSVKNAHVILSPIGRLVADEWARSHEVRSGIWLDAFVVMPDHFHGLVGLEPACNAEAGSPVESRAHAVRPYVARGHVMRHLYLGRFMAGFKSSCTRQYRAITGPPAGRLWQRGYYEHIVRGRTALDRIRRYIADNPITWSAKRATQDNPLDCDLKV